jgi:RHH-type proline utilization regulon transcriptional repressor/proline dehydrogenase/delta 1-pyrroline-5-carboxylate dehydrogenase
MKAGGPNYVAQFMDFTDVGAPAQRAAGIVPAEQTSKVSDGPAGATPAARLRDAILAKQLPDADRIAAAIASCETAWHDEFSKEHDHFKLVGQDNVRRYLPFHTVRVRVHADDSAFEIFTRVCAAHIAGCRVTASFAGKSATISLLEELTESWAGAIEFVEESDEQLALAIRAGQTDRLRFAAPERVPLAVLTAGNEAGGCIVSTPVSGEGRLEMLWYLREQSISTDYHRYGNLGLRASEQRAEVV